jgi:catechol 2,3-dioxygenase-like lactoylglutathione lyase family enzyme
VARNRQTLARTLAVFVFVFAAAAVPLRVATIAAQDAPLVRSVDAVGFTVSDMDRSVDFFSRVLSFEKVSDIEVYGTDYEHLQGVFGLRMRVVRMRLSDETIELTEYLTPKGRPYPHPTRSNDRWFQHIAIITPDMDRAYAWLRKNRVEHASTGPQKLPEYIKAAAGIQAFYFRDPDGHFLEILSFPPDKGEKWHALAKKNPEKLFLGIDHTAIVVGDAETSLKFYRDTLGLRVAGESENYGPEQEHLNNVFGARLRITSIRAASGPGIEFLEYLAPGDGRPMPADEKANDIVHWQTRLNVADAVGAARAVRGKYAFVSTADVELPDNRLGFRRAVLVRDPDGHVMVLASQ